MEGKGGQPGGLQRKPVKARQEVVCRKHGFTRSRDKILKLIKTGKSVTWNGRKRREQCKVVEMMNSASMNSRERPALKKNTF